MKCFIYKDGRVQVDIGILLVKEFAALWDRDKDQALQELKYIYLLESYDVQNPFKDYSDEERPDRVADNVFGRKYKPDKLVQAALVKFCELRDNRTSMRLLAAAKRAIEKVIQYFDTVDFTLTDDKGKPIHDINKLTKTLSGTGGLLKSFAELEEKVKMDNYEAAQTQGARAINPFEQ